MSLSTLANSHTSTFMICFNGQVTRVSQYVITQSPSLHLIGSVTALAVNSDPFVKLFFLY